MSIGDLYYLYVNNRFPPTDLISLAHGDLTARPDRFQIILIICTNTQYMPLVILIMHPIYSDKNTSLSSLKLFGWILLLLTQKY